MNTKTLIGKVGKIGCDSMEFVLMILFGINFSNGFYNMFCNKIQQLYNIYIGSLFWQCINVRDGDYRSVIIDRLLNYNQYQVWRV
jgi:hypothetical protein